jgi:hypothetical protein
MEIIMNKLIGLFAVVASLCGASVNCLMADSLTTNVNINSGPATNPVLPSRDIHSAYANKSIGELKDHFKQNYEDQTKRNEADSNNALLAELLQGYTPARHSEYVIRIMQSNLPSQVKQQTIQQLDMLARRAG